MEVPRGEIPSIMTIKKFVESSAVMSYAIASALSLGSVMSPVGAALATSSSPTTTPTTEVQTASIRKTACSFFIFAVSWGYGTDYNYKTCM